jgi:hypothetical protein
MKEMMSLLVFIKVPPAVPKLFLAVTPSAAIEIKDLSEFTCSYSPVLMLPLIAISLRTRHRRIDLKTLAQDY